MKYYFPLGSTGLFVHSIQRIYNNSGELFYNNTELRIAAEHRSALNLTKNEYISVFRYLKYSARCGCGPVE